MSNTYTQIHIQAVFAVQNREALIAKAWREDRHKYITGVVQAQGHKLLAVGGMPDHVHLLFGMRPIQSLSDLLQDVKSGSSGWINKQRFTMGRFSWQEGYGAFSYSRSQLPQVIRYIANQEKHHATTPFLDEYRHILKSLGIPFDERYIFTPVV
jgi:Transposase and inactivated derivatives